jgi:hypothetical protein
MPLIDALQELRTRSADRLRVLTSENGSKKVGARPGKLGKIDNGVR